MENTAGNLSGDVRPPKKRPESAQSVISNDDLLIEILIRLPILSLLLFKSVSKRWLSLIKSSNFTRKLDPPYGLFFKSYSMLPGECKLFNYDFMPLDIRIPSASNFAFDYKVPPGYVEILQSCNGLLLCHTSSCKKLYVYNPSIKGMFKMIPEPGNVKFDPRSFIAGTRMMFDPTKSPHYKVIHSELPWDAVGVMVHIYIYSSETGVWSACEERFHIKSLMCFRDGVYWNDAIHWVNDVSGPPLHFKLDILNERLVLTNSKTPFTLDGMGYRDYKLFNSRGCLLLFCRVYNPSIKLYVYEMRSECSEWSVKYIVNLDVITVPLPKRWSVSSNVGCIFLGEREADSFIVIKLSDKVVQYKIMSKTLRTLVNFRSESQFDSCFEYIASFANV
ncbi:F-box protein-like protein isoform X1 [Tanacetum coccineum]